MAERSRSRAANRNKRINEVKEEEHLPAFVIKCTDDRTPAVVRDMLWTRVVSKSAKPKCHTVTTKTGKVILKPIDQETTDILKHLSKVSSLLEEEIFRWPRVIMRGVSEATIAEDIQDLVLKQNPELGINITAGDIILKPIFKTGPRDRSTTNWVLEVNPSHYGKFEDTYLYLGFMRCRVSAYEEVTQCHRCLSTATPRQSVTTRSGHVHIMGLRAICTRPAQARKVTQLALTVRGNIVAEIRPVR